MCSPGYNHNGFVATHTLRYMMYGYTFLVPINQRVLKKQSKERNISGHHEIQIPNLNFNPTLPSISLLRDLSTLCVMCHL